MRPTHHAGGNPPEDTDGYRSSFTNWETRASVRNTPRRLLDEQLDGKLYFPPELVPVIRHPAVSQQGETVMRRTLLHRLYIYLNFTAELEQLVVNPVTQQLSRKRLGFELPEHMIRDAYKICTDESWHAQFCDDLEHQIIDATGDPPVALPVPYFIRELRRLQADEDSTIRGLTEVFFTVVSETLISAILSDIPHDSRIISAVRDTVADHAQDEGRHHAFFAQFFDHAWHQLGPRQRAMIGPLLPEFIVAFLAPDFEAQTELLRIAKVAEEDIVDILEETHPPLRIQRNMRAAAQSTLRAFQRNGVLDDSRTFDTFARHGLAG